MSVMVYQRCLACHQTYVRNEHFTSVVVRYEASGRKRRVWMTYCQDCIARNPALLMDPERFPQRVQDKNDRNQE